MAELLNKFKDTLPHPPSSSTNIYEGGFSQEPTITNIFDLIDESDDEISNRSKIAFNTSTTRDYFINKFTGTTTGEGGCGSNDEWMSRMSNGQEDQAFNKFMAELITKKIPFTPPSGPSITFGSEAEMLRYLQQASSTDVTAFKGWLSTQMSSQPCYSILHQETARIIRESAAQYLSAVTETKPYTLQVPIASGADFSQGYTVRITNPSDDNDILAELALNIDGTVQFGSTYFNNIPVSDSDQPLLSGKVKLVDAKGNVVTTFKDGVGGPDLVLNIPNDNSTIALVSSITLNLSVQLPALPVDTLTNTYLNSFTAYIPFTSGFTDWVNGLSTNLKDPSYILQNPGALVAAAVGPYASYKPDAEKVEALIYISLVTWDVKTAAVLVRSGVRDIIDISDKRQEDIVAVENIDDVDDQVGDYQLFEAYEMASLAANLLDNQTFEWSTDYDNA